MTQPNDLAHPRKPLSFLAGLACLAVAGILFAGSAKAATLEEIKKRGYLIVVTEDDFRPFEFVKDGKPTGFDNEMLE
jgi:polar amino acid transport system substrate-binding protein